MANIEEIASKLKFRPVRKKLTINYRYMPDADYDNMQPLTYTVLMSKERIVTDLDKTSKEGMPGDILISGPKSEVYVIDKDNFSNKYDGEIGGDIRPKGDIRYAALYRGPEEISFKASWGEDMVLKPGDQLMRDGDRGFYRIDSAVFSETYEEVKDSMGKVASLDRWFKEKWVDISRRDEDGKHPPCGRSDASKGAYPKCRPSKKVSRQTPSTSRGMTDDEKKRATRQKRTAEKKNRVGKKPHMTSHHQLKGADAASWWKRAKSNYNMPMEDICRDSENLAAMMISDAKSYMRSDDLHHELDKLEIPDFRNCGDAKCCEKKISELQDEIDIIMDLHR
jgi:hypothetical protein